MRHRRGKIRVPSVQELGRDMHHPLFDRQVPQMSRDVVCCQPSLQASGGAVLYCPKRRSNFVQNRTRRISPLGACLADPSIQDRPSDCTQLLALSIIFEVARRRQKVKYDAAGRRLHMRPASPPAEQWIGFGAF